MMLGVPPANVLRLPVLSTKQFVVKIRPLFNRDLFQHILFQLIKRYGRDRMTYFYPLQARKVSITS